MVVSMVAALVTAPIQWCHSPALRLARCCASAVTTAPKTTPPYKDPSLPIEQRVEDLLSRMTLEEKLWQLRSENDDAAWRKAAQTTGLGETFDICRPLTTRQAALLANEVQRLARRSRLGIPIIIRDEALHGLVGNGPTSFPQAIALAATWDPELVGRVARAIARECKARGVRRVLTPVINLARDARWGRVEETFGEDPYLASVLAVAYVKNFEEEGVATCPKHFVANYGDGGRDSHAVFMSEQHLREVWLAPFEAAVRHGGARSIMTAYNSLNGRACSANRWLLTDLLKKEWGFRGVVGSDYGAAWGVLGAHHNAEDEVTAAAENINAGLDIEWPNIGLFGRPLEEAIRRKLVPMSRIDDAVRRMLRQKFELGLFDDWRLDPDESERIVQCEEHRALALEAARKSIVLLKNRGRTLPLPETVKSIALIGNYGKDTIPLGGYSGWGQETVSVLEGLQRRLPKATIRWAPGPDRAAIPGTQIIPRSCLLDLHACYFDNRDLSGEPVICRSEERIDFDWTGRSPAPGVPPTNFSARFTGKLLPPEDGEYLLAVTSDDGVRVWLDGDLVIENWTIHPPTTNTATVALKKGVPVDLRIDFYQAEGQAVLRLGWAAAPLPAPNFEEAVEAAKSSDVAIVTVGIEEGEGRDRASLDLPHGQEDLIRAVAATGTPTIVILFAGAPVTMSRWLADVDAVLDVWYPGQEGGTAIAEVLLGDVNPSGRLPVTFPRSVGQCPIYYGIYPSGRGYDYVDLTGAPLFPFGYGLSYTTFEYANLRIAPAQPRLGEPIEISFQVKNTGDRTGEEVAQLYIRDVAASMVRPLKELKDFTRVLLMPGETRKVTFVLAQDKLAFYDEKMRKIVEPGEFQVMIGASAQDIRLTGSFTIRAR